MGKEGGNAFKNFQKDCILCSRLYLLYDGKPGGRGGSKRINCQLTTLSARILETEIFFQIRKVNDFAGGELARSTGKRKRVGVSSNAYFFFNMKNPFSVFTLEC